MCSSAHKTVERNSEEEMILRRGRININKNAIERCIFSGLFSNHNYSRRRSSSYNNNNNNNNSNYEYRARA